MGYCSSKDQSVISSFTEKLFSYLEGHHWQGVSIWNFLVFLLGLHDVAENDIILREEELEDNSILKDKLGIFDLEGKFYFKNRA